MNLRHVDEYDIGLDMGTGSVGWAALGSDGELLRFKGRPAWGSRLFPSAETAESTRLARGQRRRYERRRWRLDLLQGLLQDEVEKVDSEFFIRLRQSRLLAEDRAEGHASYRWPLFNDSDFTEPEYYHRFPTIYHLRTWLMETDEKADIRLIYLAFHNIVKHRGNFLHESSPNLSARQANMLDSVERFVGALGEWCDENGIACSCQSVDIASVLEDSSKRKGDKQRAVQGMLGLEKDYAATMGKAISQAMVGYKAELSHVFFVEQSSESKFSMTDEEKVEAFRSSCPDDGAELFESLQAVHSSFVLMGILKEANGGTLSTCKVAEYQRYKENLKTLKALVREYAPKEYDAFFNGEFYEGTRTYDPAKAQGYTKYDIGPKNSAYKPTAPMRYEDFEHAVQKLFANTAAANDERYVAMMDGFKEGSFLRRLKTSDNGSIPYQLHLEEMQAIIENQRKHYPFLKEEEEKLVSLVKFRIPYYVGPLTKLNAAKDAKGEDRFAWSVRKPGQERTSIKPWNWEEVIDRHQSAENFIMRMTGTCTYLQGEAVLPRCSLLYEEFCVLNELNGSRWTLDGDKEPRFDRADREGIVRELFKQCKTVSYKRVADWMCRTHGFSSVRVSGGQGETGFESKLGSHYFFCKDVFGVDELPGSDIPMIEEIILWNTLFEDRKILREKIEAKYSDRLSAEQIKTICKKRFTGWGRLSRKLLVGVSVDTNDGPKTIMDVLREEHPNAGHDSSGMVFMEVLRNDELGFQKRLDELNAAYIEGLGQFGVDDLPGSPALRRSIKQAQRIVREIASIAGKAPEHIYIEVTRDEDPKNKGKRTKRRYDNLREALEAFKHDDPDVWRELSERAPQDLDERLTLYFMQRGRCLYSEKPIDIARIAGDLYEVDHILPQTYIKDDSFENKALVLRGENQRKTDTLLIDPSIRRARSSFWKSLHDAKLIGDKKFKNLMRTSVGENDMKGFIARQLVETSQVVKMTQQLLAAEYQDTRIVPIKASLSSQLRDAKNLVKCREANDFHHAHDAYLACQMGRFITERHPSVYENPIGLAHAIKALVRQQGEEFRKTRQAPGSSVYLVASFQHRYIDAETGEIVWDAEKEINRIRKCLNYKDCFISRMPELATGAFWDQTIYSPRGGKTMELPVKQGLDPQKYGSFSREQFAYFFVYEAINPKKKTKLFQFAPVPVHVATRFESDSTALEDYARRLAGEAGLEFTRIAREKVYKYQLIELDGDRLYITGKKEVRNAQQLAFSQKETALLKRLVEGKEASERDRIALFESVAGKMLKRASRLWRLLRFESAPIDFRDVDETQQAGIIRSLIQSGNGKTNAVDLSSVGLGKMMGCIQPTFSKELSSPSVEFYFIDQSVTGMFERRCRLEL
ncbi:type II CRISPR RNA-guided endonuclease Cas9 [Raoultibacter phocaeensis]|uniref:type II CRISPR RNA-guided endonuclease Cas9 n=1 Tax=Raoultibacter phocaeensis TaxID=2479841 RepID=UPI00111A975B|nr:type II CRISPR RNA-guided endonuclease Cas9 [Raoultibacter phocaeensis]